MESFESHKTHFRVTFRVWYRNLLLMYCSYWISSILRKVHTLKYTPYIYFNSRTQLGLGFGSYSG